jgi:1-deoxy-D-xylulose-5-phosphate synthase
VVALYATFLNRAFDQVLMDVALHRLPVTFALTSAGVTGKDGPSHNGMWDLAMLGMVPGLRIAAPRDEATLRAELREAVEYGDGPTAVRFPKTTLHPDIPALRQVGGVDVLAGKETGPASEQVDVLLVAVGSTATMALEVAERVGAEGVTTTVVDPRWVQPVNPELVRLAGMHRLVVTVEDGVRTGGAGAALSQALRDAGSDVPAREVGIPADFLDHGSIPDVRERIGLTPQRVARQVVEWVSRLDERSATVAGTRSPS